MDTEIKKKEKNYNNSPDNEMCRVDDRVFNIQIYQKENTTKRQGII